LIANPAIVAPAIPEGACKKNLTRSCYAVRFSFAYTVVSLHIPKPKHNPNP